MATKSKAPTPPKEPAASKTRKLTEIVGESVAFEPRTSETPDIELVGRIRKSEDGGNLILLMPSDTPGIEHAVEIKASDITEHQQIFEDTSGESSYSVRLSPTATVKMVLPASALAKPPKQFDPKASDPKQFDPKQFDPKASDPKFDPKQFEPKSFDPKQFDPKQFDPKISDPKFDPKRFEPKGFDPKHYDPKQLEPKGFDPKQFEPKGFEPKAFRAKEL